MYLLTYGIRIRSEDSNEPNEWKNRKIITETYEQEKESESEWEGRNKSAFME